MWNQKGKAHYNYFDIQFNVFEINANYNINNYCTFNHIQLALWWRVIVFRSYCNMHIYYICLLYVDATNSYFEQSHTNRIYFCFIKIISIFENETV